MIAAKYLYDSFGNTLSQYGLLADANTYRFSSKEWNANSGIYYYLYRFYDPNLPRWLTQDPIQERGGFNLYGYIYNDPVNNIDTDGRFVTGVVGIATTAGTASSGGAGVTVSVTGGSTVAGVGVGTVAVGVGSAVAVGGAIGYGASQLPVYGGGTVADFYGELIYEDFWPKPLPVVPPIPPTKPPKDPDNISKCEFYKAWSDWANNRPAGDGGKGWKRCAPCDDCYNECKASGRWPFAKCPMGGPNGPRWPKGGKWPGGGDPALPTPGQY